MDCIQFCVLIYFITMGKMYKGFLFRLKGTVAKWEFGCNKLSFNAMIMICAARIGFDFVVYNRCWHFIKVNFVVVSKSRTSLIRRCRKHDISCPLKVGTKRTESVCIARTAFAGFLDFLTGWLLTKRTSRKQHVWKRECSRRYWIIQYL